MSQPDNLSHGLPHRQVSWKRRRPFAGSDKRESRADPDQAVPPTGVTDESELLQQILDGDRQAAETLVRQTYQKTYAALFRLCGNADLAADLTQDTYRKAWSSLASFRRRARFSTWLYTIAYNTFLNHQRQATQTTPLTDEAEIPDREPAIDHRLDRVQQFERLRRSVMELPEDLRLVVTAHYWGEVPIAEIAQFQGLTPSAVRKRLGKARRILGKRSRAVSKLDHGARR